MSFVSVFFFSTQVMIKDTRGAIQDFNRAGILWGNFFSKSQLGF